MDAHTEVETENEEVEVVAESETCAHSQRLEEAIVTELATHLIVVTMHEPHVSCIDEESTLEGIDDGETVFDIHSNFHVTCLV